MPRPARLLPAALAACAALLAVSAFFHVGGTAFQAPILGVQSQQPRLQQMGAQKQVFAGSSMVPSLMASAQRPPAAVLDDLEQTAAPMYLVVAATALAAAAATKDPAAEEEKKGGLPPALKLPIFVGLWYFFNVQYNIQNKMLLQAFKASWAVSWLQLAAGIPICFLMWATGFVKKPNVTMDDIMKLAPSGAAFAAGQVMTVASLGSVAVSFTHVVKALEPAVNAIASALILGQVFHPMVYASLLPVFFGVALASSSELSFTMFGFLTAMASNFCFVTRNVLATKLGSVGDMGTDKTERKTNQLAVLTMVATAVLFPIALVLPGGLLSIPAAWQGAIAKGVLADKLAYMMATSGFYFFMYQLSSFWVLSQVPPITHSVLNTLKRVVIIVVSIVVFGTPVTTMGSIGTATAIGGVMLYTVTKKYYSSKGK